MRSENRLREVVGCDGELQLPLPSAKFPIHYLVGSQALISLSEMGNGIRTVTKRLGQIRTGYLTRGILRAGP